jgi:hypothetical protein
MPIPTIKQFTQILLESPVKSEILKDYWEDLSEYNKQQYIVWFYSDRSKPLDEFWGVGTPPVEQTRVEFFEKFTKHSLGLEDYGDMKGGSRRHRRSTPKSSRKFKKSSKRVFRKKSRSTRRR